MTFRDPPAVTQAQADAEREARIAARASIEDKPHCDKPGTCDDCPWRIAARTGKVRVRPTGRIPRKESA